MFLPTTQEGGQFHDVLFQAIALRKVGDVPVRDGRDVGLFQFHFAAALEWQCWAHG
jgi:hypothetical protein